MDERPGEISAFDTPASTGASESDTDRMRDDIERTRADMGETIDALQQRLSPESLRHQATDSVREATIGRAGRLARGAGDTAKGTGMTIVDTVRQNPLPAAMAGIGLGWLVMKGRQQGGHYHPFDRGYLGTGQEEGGMGQVAGDIQARGGQMASSIQGTASEMAGQAQDQMQRVGSQAQQQMQRTRGQMQRMMQQNPLAMGVLAFGLGAAVGYMVPETRREHEIMGESRDRLMERAESVAQDTMQRVQHVAEEAKHSAEQEARAQDLTQ